MTKKLSTSDSFALLANRHRRLLLQILAESGLPLRTMELAESIADRAYETPTAEDLRSTYIALYHNHLPRLSEAGVVVYDENAGIVRLGHNFDVVIHLVDEAEEQELSWGDE